MRRLAAVSGATPALLWSSFLSALPAARRRCFAFFPIQNTFLFSGAAKNRLHRRAFDFFTYPVLPDRVADDFHRSPVHPQCVLDIFGRMTEADILAAGKKHAALQTLL